MEASTFLGELMGTFVLILLGQGVVANVLLTGTKSSDSGWIGITTAWGLAVTMGIFVAQKFGSIDAHLNPAFTIAFAYDSGNWSQAATFILAQFIGAFLGATVNWLFYYPHWAVTEDKGAKLAIFATGPAIRHTWSNFFGEAVGTFILVIGAISIYAQTDSGLKPFLVGALVWVIGLALGGTTGYAINPARDLAPRIAHTFLPIAGKGDSDWKYAWVPVLGPIVGGLAATLFML